MRLHTCADFGVLLVMNDVIEFEGRGRAARFAWPTSVGATDGKVYSLVLTVQGVEFISYYCRMIVIDEWGIRLVNPFRQISNFSNGYDHACYLPKDLFVFCAAKIEEVPEREWMTRECY